MRRRVDDVWAVVHQEHGFAGTDEAMLALEPLMREDFPPLPVPAGTAMRPALHNVKGRDTSDLFKLLASPSHHLAAWLLNQVYLALPTPDANWARDFQTVNFHTRMWELHLLACFREQGLLVTQPQVSPDFRIENRRGGAAWVEAVTANPSEPYDHVGSKPLGPPQDRRERLIGPAAVRFAKTLKSKLDRKYDRYAHVEGQPFAIALADFHAPSSMVWSREALVCYLYGFHSEEIEIDGERVISATYVDRLLGEQAIPAGLFRTGEHPGLSAVIFTNTCAISKFNRVAVSGGAATKGLRYVRIGEFYDRNPGARRGIPFCLDVASAEYRRLWPRSYEPWCADLEVFHNPFAQYPLPPSLLPEATHWLVEEGELCRKHYYETSILRSQTFVQEADQPFPSLREFQHKMLDDTDISAD
ncbi:hypothetical protein LJR267_010648 [Paraburkholderia hospita]|uniref:hypothetical protein n=1 Tax=Paraburkholderia hospita TaxID=169430 RepID=UPI003ECD928A